MGGNGVQRPQLTTPLLERAGSYPFLPASGWSNSLRARPRRAYLETVFDERLGVEETVKQHLPRCHRHLQTKSGETEAPGSGGPAPGAAATAAAILCGRSPPFPPPAAAAERPGRAAPPAPAPLPPSPPARAPAAAAAAPAQAPERPGRGGGPGRPRGLSPAATGGECRRPG